MNLVTHASSPSSDSSSSPSSSPAAGEFKGAAILGALGTLGTALTLPFSNALLPATRVGLSQGIVLSVVQGGIVLLLAWAGLRMGRSLGLGTPVLRGVVPAQGRAESRVGVDLALSLALGLALGGGIAFAGTFLSIAVKLPHVARYLGLFASLGAPVVEEVMFRLFTMTAAVWLLAKITKSQAPVVFVLGSAIAALVFAAAHLPQAVSVFGSITPAIALFCIVANAAVGIACGVLFWKKGLAFAIAAHLGADLVLHVLFTP